MTGEFSLYVHVPFCTRTCPYCSFYQVPYRAGRESRFVDAVLREAQLVSEELQPGERGPVETMYWGGGTPSLLSAGAVERLSVGFAELFDVPTGVEFTVEANPGEAPPASLAALRAAGANRLSLGCQSFHPERLAFLGRWHTPAQNRNAVADARAAGFENVSLDLIFNLPPSFPADGWRADVAEALALDPEHLSLYGLTIEPRTAFAVRADRGKLTLLDPDAYAEEYLWASATLAAAGYVHYETSSFARPGRESRHNRRYWQGGDYLGLGPAAHSFWRGRRWANVASLERWLAGVEAGRLEREVDEDLNAGLERGGDGGEGEPSAAEPSAARYAEVLYLGLRSDAGLERGELRGDAGRLERFTADLVEAGLARRSGDRLILTDAGHLVLDEIIARLLALEERTTPAVRPLPTGA